MPSMLKATALAAGTILLQSCATPTAQTGLPRAKAAPSDTDRIEYAIGPCRGFCPTYSFSISTDGNARFKGIDHTLRRGEIAVDGDPALFARLKAAIAPARPAAARRTITSESCNRFATDQQVITVAWWSGGQPSQTLEFDLGCRDPELQPIRSALTAARRLMPIDELVGRADGL